MTSKTSLPEQLSEKSVGELLANLAISDAQNFAPFFRRVRDIFPDETLRVCIRHIADHTPDPASEQMLPWIVSGERYFKLLLDPDFLAIDKARRAAEVFRTSDPRFIVNFSRLTIDTGVENDDRVSRALALLEGLGDYQVLLGWLRNLTTHADARVRSKAAKALCQLRPNAALVQRQLKSHDARVRANAIEALWDVRTPEAANILQEALSDSSHRVVVNALVGLYRFDPADETAFQKLLQLSAHDSEMFRAAAAWAFGYLMDAHAIPALQKLINDPSSLVRERATKALAECLSNSEPNPE